MNSQIAQLADIADKDSRLIIGLMSGTSLDGLDIALCDVTGHGVDTEITVRNFSTVNYEPEFIAEITTIFAKQHISLEKLCLLNEKVGWLHGQLVKRQLAQWQVESGNVDLVASHGQTIYHAPQSQHQLTDYPNGTLQIGDGDHVARETGIITIADFRQRHIAAGGEGAPLVVYGDSLLFGHQTDARILLNIGGIANFTLLPAKQSELPAFCSDIGPGNTLMDAIIQRNHKPLRYDHNAEIARRGNIAQPLLNRLKQHSFFNAPYPKTTGPEEFNIDYVDDCLAKCNLSDLSSEDVTATLNQFTADIISNSLKASIESYDIGTIYVSGGGALNPLLMESIQANLPTIKVETTHALGIHPDAKEAVLFALLANECIAGDFNAVPNIMAMPTTTMGKVCLPA